MLCFRAWYHTARSRACFGWRPRRPRSTVHAQVEVDPLRRGLVKRYAVHHEPRLGVKIQTAERVNGRQSVYAPFVESDGAFLTGTDPRDANRQSRGLFAMRGEQT